MVCHAVPPGGVCVYACPDGPDLLCDVGILCKAGASAATQSLREGIVLTLSWGSLPEQTEEASGSGKGLRAPQPLRSREGEGVSAFPLSGTWGTTGPGFKGLCGLVRRGRGVDSPFACVGV